MLQQHCISPNFHGKMQCSRQPKSAFLLVFACSHVQIQRRGTRSRQKQSKMNVFCLPPPSKSPRTDLKVDKNEAKQPYFVYRRPPDLKVDKNEAKRPHFVYRCLQKSPHGTRSRTNYLKIEKMFYRRLQIRLARSRK